MGWRALAQGLAATQRARRAIHAAESLAALVTELDLEVLDDMKTIVRTGDPSVQQDLETRVENFVTARGILHEWDDALDKARAWRF